jgi:hypothetical protein
MILEEILLTARTFYIGKVRDWGGPTCEKIHDRGISGTRNIYFSDMARSDGPTCLRIIYWMRICVLLCDRFQSRKYIAFYMFYQPPFALIKNWQRLADYRFIGNEQHHERR